MHYDVVVVGGGSAGVAAAVGAKNAGADTLLLERNPYLGGEATHSGVTVFCGFFSCGQDPVKVVSGVGDMVLEEMEKLGPVIEYVISPNGNQNILFHPEYLKCALDNLMEREQVDYLLHARVIAAETDGRNLTAVRCADDAGEFLVTASAFVDASGDANLAYLAGAETMWGENGGGVQAATLPFRLTGVDTACDLSPSVIEQAVVRAKKEGIPHLTRERGFLLRRAGSGMVSVLLPSVMPEGITAEDLTRMERNARKQVLSYVRAFRAYVPGMEHCELAEIGPSIGFRETRRLSGRTMLSGDDVLSRRRRPDGVARGGWKPELHRTSDRQAVWMEVPGKSYFDIPFGALWSVNRDNLFGAGRILCADETAFAAARVMGTCFATGHAAGVGAACRALKGRIDVEAIRAELTRQHALI